SEAPHLDQVDEGLDGFALAEVVTEIELLAIATHDPMRTLKPIGKKLAGRVTGAEVIEFAPLLHRRAQRIDHPDRRLPTIGLDLWWLAFRNANPMLARFLPRCEQRLQRRRVDRDSLRFGGFVHVSISTVMLVSQPNTSTTLTQAVCLPG